MRKSAVFAASIGIAFGALAQDASAACKLSMSVGTTVYSFLSGTQAQLPVTVTHSSGQGCSYFVAITRGGSSSYNRTLFNGSYTIAYQLYTGNPFNFVMEDVPDATSSNVLSGSFGSGNTSSQTVSYWAVLTGNTSYQAYGTYQDTVTVRLYSGTVSSSSLVSSQNVIFSYQEARQVALSLVTSGAPFNASSTSMDLNFGTLSSGESLGFDIVTMYNAGYSLSISSQNNGVMARSGGGTSKVPYTLTASGTPVGLGSSALRPVTIATNSGVSPAGGSRTPIAVTIGSTASSLSGTYSDNLTLVVTSTQ